MILGVTNDKDKMEAVSLIPCTYCGSPTYREKYCCDGCETLSEGFTQVCSNGNDYAYLDQANFKELFRGEHLDFDYQLYVEGIHCSSCVHLLERLPSYDPTVIGARVDYARSRLLLKVAENFSLANAIQKLSAMGYKAHFLKPFDQTHFNQQMENKVLLKKLAIAGACAGNIMLFVIPVYSGLDGPWQTAFNWMSFALFFPILFYSGTTFYKSAWAGLRLRVINIDLPITIALVSGFLLSTVNLIRNQGAIYYDSTASFVFLILCSRYLLRRIQQNLLSSFRTDENLDSERFILVSDHNEEFISSNEIRKNDLIKLNAGQICPIDGIIESENALADVSVLNGEPMPRYFENGMDLLAGSKIVSDTILLRVKAEPNESHLAKILDQLRAGSWRKSKFVSLTDKCSQVLIVTVFLIAIVTFLFLFNQDPQEGFNRALALIVLACPCALALGSPLAVALAVKKAQSKGILIKNTDALEKILKLKSIFFDKTGTLTESELKLASPPDSISQRIKTILISLEQKSFHPVAFALRREFLGTRPVPVKEYQEISGKGVQGYIDAHFYEFGQTMSPQESNYVLLTLKEDGVPLVTLSFENSIREDARTTLGSLEDNSVICYILSGDCQKRANEVGIACGLPPERIYGNCTAEEKFRTLGAYENTCMIGDGTNDALALKAADVGIAVKGSTPINFQAADIFFTRSGLNSLIELFEVARKAKSILIRNLVFSLLYNFIGGTLAILGFVSPLLAAILMPISSFIIIVSTLWGLR